MALGKVSPFPASSSGPGTRQPQIHEVRVAVGIQEHVGGLDVPVEHPFSVGEIQRGRHLVQQKSGLLGREGTPPEGVLQRSALQQAGHLVGRVVFRVEIEDGQEVGVFETGHEARLAPKAGSGFLLLREGAVEDLDGHPAVHGAVVGPKDRGHSAPAQLLHDLVGTHTGPDHLHPAPFVKRGYPAERGKAMRPPRPGGGARTGRV
jgi:hypothetical protein